MDKIDFWPEVPPTVLECESYIAYPTNDSRSRAYLAYVGRLGIFYSPGTRGKNCIYKLVNNIKMEVSTKVQQAHFFFITKVGILD